jgi:hypothetical protein
MMSRKGWNISPEDNLRPTDPEPEGGGIILFIVASAIFILGIATGIGLSIVFI